jgi:ribosomal protein L23
MKHYSDIIIAPVITEKSMANRQNNVYTFKVVDTATKDEIKKLSKKLSTFQ